MLHHDDGDDDDDDDDHDDGDFEFTSEQTKGNTRQQLGLQGGEKSKRGLNTFSGGFGVWHFVKIKYIFNMY